MSSKLDCPDTASKIYWSKINTFLHKRKIPNEPPHLNGKLANGKLQWQMANSYRIFQPFFNLKSSNCLKSFEVNENDLPLIIKNLNAIKAHG